MTTSSAVPRSDDAAVDRLKALLERAATGQDSQAWSDLWTELYHNGTLDAANQWRQVTAHHRDYCYLVEAILNLEGDIHWAEDLLFGVVSEEYELECPDPDGCTSLWVILGERGFFSTAEDYALSEDDVETFPLHPADPGDLQGLGRRLYDLAVTDGHEEVAHALTHAFGEATCPECGRRLSVVEQIVARSS
ncbi:hypothetical protein [Streptomyces sp. NPDC057072]|uniref:hypothetical protein n=1 Tax=Streptomyces sp. NPDC057072 TaxID=3346014 RepID=UPI0036300DCE